MTEIAKNVERLDTGELLTIRVVEPPLGPLADSIEYWWRDIRGPLLASELADTSLDRFVIGEVASRPSMTPAPAPRRCQAPPL